MREETGIVPIDEFFHQGTVEWLKGKTSNKMFPPFVHGTLNK